MPCFGPTNTTSRAGAEYGLHITEGNSNYAYFSGLHHKSGAPGALGVWHASMTAAGMRPLVTTTDMGREFVGQSAGEVYAHLGLASRLRAPEAHADGVESVHRRFYRSARPAMLAGDVPPSLWEEACV